MRIIALPRGMTPPRIERKALAPIEKLRPKEREEEHVVVMLTLRPIVWSSCLCARRFVAVGPVCMKRWKMGGSTATA